MAMKKISLLFYISLIFLKNFAQQIPDISFSYAIKAPVYKKGMGTVITLDEAHFNFHTLPERYRPFGNLLEKDGYILKSGTQKFTSSYLSDINILVIANAMADTGEWKLPAKSAFSKEEINAVNKWVQNGGSLFLIADHMPFPGAAADLALSFGFNFINGFALKPDMMQAESFSIKEKNLKSSKITLGRNKSEQIDSILSFTGQGFIAPKNAMVITELKNDYKIWLPAIAWEFDEKTASMSSSGLVNGAFMHYGKGRIVVFGEAAMFSAQLAGEGKEKIGMNNRNAKQNPQLLLNIIHWLDKII